MKNVIFALSLLAAPMITLHAQWEQVSMPDTLVGNNVTKLYYDGSTFWAGGWSRICKSEDKGDSWTSASTGINVIQGHVKDIIKVDNYVYACFGGNGNHQVYRTNNGGDNWEVDTAGWIGFFYATKLYRHGAYVVALMESNIVLYKTNSDAKWSKLNVPDDRFMTPRTIFSIGDTLVLEDGQNGPALALTTDMGQTWTIRDINWGPGIPENGGFLPTQVFHGKEKTDHIFGVYKGHDGNVTPYKEVFAFLSTTDGMSTFQTVNLGFENDAPLNTMWINNQDIYVAIQGANSDTLKKILYSNDAGTTWSDRTENMYSFVQYKHLPVSSIEVVNGVVFIAGNQPWILKYGKDNVSTENVYGLKNDVRLHPNPAKDRLILSHLKNGSLLSIMDLSGKVLYQSIATNTYEIVNISNFTNGIYIVQVAYNNAIVNKKVIIRN